MMFTSQAIDRDPEPYLTLDGERVRQPFTRYDFNPSDVANEYAPRCEYTAPVNPILAALRQYAETGSVAEESEAIMRALDHWETRGWGINWGASPAHIDHARKVLTRLAVLA